MIKTVGSICSGIEAASVAWKPLGAEFKWFSEIADFQSRVLQEKFPTVPNLGDMNHIADDILQGKICAPDLICGGTPCQAFSFAGAKKGLEDYRGNLTLKFVEIIEANDEVRLKNKQSRCKVFWENVEGVLTDKTNAFGCLISSLAGLDEAVEMKRWSTSGLIKGPKRKVAWRVLDAKYFGLPQQRRRLYVLAGGKDFNPENILFEEHIGDLAEYPEYGLIFNKEGHSFEIFRAYSDCLYSAYGTKWNGNAAANNGSLFVTQDGRIRRLSPLECERLMGFPDNYTDVKGAKKTNRYQAIGNSWAVLVVEWIGRRLMNYNNLPNLFLAPLTNQMIISVHGEEAQGTVYDFNGEMIQLNNGAVVNTSFIPEQSVFRSLKDIVTAQDVPDSIYISPVGCKGILRRSQERKTNINMRLRLVLERISREMDEEEIERRSRVQKRGRLSVYLNEEPIAVGKMA